MPQSYTLEQLQKMGARPKSYTIEELQSMGAKPVTSPAEPVDNTAIKEAQAAKFPSSQEQGKGGAGVESRFGASILTNNPITVGLDALGGGLIEGLKNLASVPGAIVNAATAPPTTPTEDKLSMVPLAAKRILVDPSIENIKAWWESAKHEPNSAKALINSVRAVPIVGPPVAGLMEKAASGDPLGAVGEGIAYAAAPEAVKEIRSGAGKVAAKVAPEMYQKALQPSPRTYSAGEIRQMAKTGMENKIPVSRSGLNRLDTLVNDLNKSIESDIAANPNAPVDKFKVASRLTGTATKVANQVNPESDLAAVAETGNEFLRTQPNSIPAAAAQELKKGTYRQVGDKAMGGEVKAASVKAQKALAKGLKEELEGIFPEIKAKNAAEGKLLDLRPELEAAVNRLGNRRISIANALNILADPAVTSRVSIYLNKLGVAPEVVQSRIAAALKATVPAAVGGPANRRDALEVLGQPTP